MPRIVVAGMPLLGSEVPTGSAVEEAVSAASVVLLAALLDAIDDVDVAVIDDEIDPVEVDDGEDVEDVPTDSIDNTA